MRDSVIRENVERSSRAKRGGSATLTALPAPLASNSTVPRSPVRPEKAAAWSSAADGDCLACVRGYANRPAAEEPQVARECRRFPPWRVDGDVAESASLDVGGKGAAREIHIRTSKG